MTLLLWPPASAPAHNPSFPQGTRPVASENPRSNERLSARDTNVAGGLGMLDAVTQEVELAVEGSATVASVRPRAPVKVAVTHDQRGLPGDHAALPATVDAFRAPAHLQTFQQSQLPALILEHG